MLVPQTMLEIESAYKNKNWDKFYHAAHKIKSNLAMMGMEDVVAQAEAIETEAKREGNKAMLAPIVMSLSLHCATAVKDLKEEVRKMR